MKYSRDRDILRSFKGIHTRLKNLQLHYGCTIGYIHSYIFLNKVFLIFAFLFSSLSKFGLSFKNFFLIFVHFQPGDNHLAWVNVHMDSCAISFLTLYTLDVDDLFLSVHLDSLADLLTLIVSSNHLDLIIRVDGHGAEVLPHSLLESGDDRIFLHTCKGALKWHLGFLLLSEITKGLNFLVTIYLAPGRLRPVCTGPEVQIIFQNNHVLYIPTNNE